MNLQLKLPLLLTSLVLLTNFSTAQASKWVHANGPYFEDSTGKKVLLRGINLSNAAKVPPFHALNDPSELDPLRALGFNNLRLLFIWEAFEPEQGKYNLAYLDELGKTVAHAAELGMSTVIDFHMDGFSRYTVGGCGSGAPAWAVPFGENPQDGQICRLWNFFEALDFINPFSNFDRSLRGFYDDPNGVRGRYLLAWTQIARYFSHYPSVIGYDLLNEPWGGEPNQISPLYEDAAKVIRAEDPDAILFLEPSVIVALGWSGTFLRTPSFQNFAYAPHDYDAVALGFSVWLDDGLFLDTNFGRIRKQARKWNAPVYIGEFGVAGSGGAFMRSLIKHYYGLFDRHFTSSSQWDYSPNYTPGKGDGWNYENMSIIDQNGKLRRNFIPRVYPASVAGIPGQISVKYADDPHARTFQFSWIHDPSEGSTEFFLPPALYPDAAKLAWSSPNSDLNCSVDAAASVLSCRSDVAGQKKIRIEGPLN